MAVTLAAGSFAAAQRPYVPYTRSNPSKALLIRELLSSENPRTRIDAAAGLGELGDPGAIGSLATAASGDDNQAVRHAAAESIVQIQSRNGAYRPVTPSYRPVPPPNPVTPTDTALAELVESWYGRYLHRHSDLAGLQNHVSLLRQGIAPDTVLAGILSSQEYYQLHGENAAQFIAGLYVDVWGRYASDSEIDNWLAVLRRFRGDRDALAREFLRAAKWER
jgi:hypothetical protein